MLSIELTASQERALRRLVSLLDAAGARYAFTGGFASATYTAHAGRFTTWTSMWRATTCPCSLN